MKYCDHYAAALDLFVDGELTPAEMAQIQTHLDACPGCRAYVDDALAMRAAFADAEDTVVPEGFTESVMAAVAAREAAKKPARTPRWLKAAMPLAACLAIVLVLQNGPLTGNGGPRMGGAAKTAAAPAAAREETVTEAAPASIAARTTADAPAAEAPAAAAPAAEMESAAETGPELPAQMAVGASLLEDAAEAPAHDGKAKSTMTTNTFSYTADFTARMEVPAEGAALLEGFLPAEETETEAFYHLTQEEFSALQEALAEAGIPAIVEAGLEPKSETTLVVLKK